MQIKGTLRRNKFDDEQIGGYCEPVYNIKPLSEYSDIFANYVDKNKNKLLYFTISRKYKKRSIPENNYYWGVIIEMLYKHSNRFAGYTKQEIHDALRWQHLRIERIGKPPSVRSTADESFTTKDAEEYYEMIRIEASVEDGITIPLPNEKI